MATWLVPQKAAKYIKEHDPSTMIGENTLRTLAKNGFPCLKIDSRTLINVDSFETDLSEYARLQSLMVVEKPVSKIRKLRYQS